jgi:hypothetical protein
MQKASTQLHDLLQFFWLALLFGSTPIALLLVYKFEFPREQAAILNSYAFSIAFWGLYLTPLISPVSTGSFKERLRLSHRNWILYLTCFTEAIQIVHSLSCSFLYAARDQPQEWAFYAYSLSDKRWRDYSPDGGRSYGLPFEVNLINLNDGLLGFVVLCCWLYWNRESTPRTSAVLALAVVFRDATLWRETVEYLLQHHFQGYPYSTAHPALRPHAIFLLWSINGLWLICPIFTLIWAYHLMLPEEVGKSKTGMGGEAKKIL